MATMNAQSMMLELREATGRNFGASVKQGRWRIVEFIEVDGDPYAEEVVYSQGLVLRDHLFALEAMIDAAHEAR
jgi:hypothetical protein